MRSRRTLLAAAVATPILGLAAAACGGSHETAAHGAPVVRVSERDFAISVHGRVHPGKVTFRVTNKGPDDHELILARPPDGLLPLRSDDLTVNEEALDRYTVANLEPGAPGSVRDVTVRLRRGTYVLFCNMSGHYMAGMHTTLVVS